MRLVVCSRHTLAREGRIVESTTSGRLVFAIDPHTLSSLLSDLVYFRLGLPNRPDNHYTPDGFRLSLDILSK